MMFFSQSSLNPRIVCTTMRMYFVLLPKAYLDTHIRDLRPNGVCVGVVVQSRTTISS